MNNNRYWVSWYEGEQDYRPLNDPPNAAVIGWWCSGESDKGHTICAVVEARNSREASEAILKDWPEAKNVDDWRFIVQHPGDWEPGDRFPLSDWMAERFGLANKLDH